MQTAAAFVAARYPFLNELLTRRLGLLAMAFAGAVLATNLTMFGHLVATSKDYVTRFGPAIGGDFIVFDSAATAAAAGDAAAIYDPAAFSGRLTETVPERRSGELSWQYPPSMLVLVAPLALAPYLPSYALWIVAAGGLFLAGIRSLWSDRRALFLVLASPAAFQSVITGQTGFLTAALLSASGAFAASRPMIAGIAAGLLSVKPQLGLLIPIAFACAGCWRAFAAAAATAAALAAASVIAFGAEPWTAFFAAVLDHGERMQTDVFPYYKLVTPFGGAMMIGAPKAAAIAVQGLASLAVAAAVGMVWRRSGDWALRCAVLCAGALLATPYAFYYEIAVLVPAAVLIARRGMESGWLSGERPALALLWAAPMALPGAKSGLPLSFMIAAAAFALVLRRALQAGQPRPALS